MNKVLVARLICHFLLGNLFLDFVSSTQQDRIGLLDNIDKEHLKHDVKEQYFMDINENETNDREMLFYNFKLHDYDHNLLLDGLELLAALGHDRKMPTEYLSDATNVDLILKSYDLDNDGFISFSEYMKAVDNH